ncbi:disease resistance protein RPM1-like [Cornus florida]|uniref:disease resistance protein RPM1-like n=1 Tax=Cornus florida TaxID=4283 RepID=UPI002897C1BC|nr:disease resistance protein RPM1-like [Cornus florida]
MGRDAAILGVGEFNIIVAAGSFFLEQYLEEEAAGSFFLEQYLEEEVALMADIAVTAALIFADDVLSYLKQERKFGRTVRTEIEKIKNWLETMQAYVKDMEGKESKKVLKIRIRRIRELAYDIEDILDEYMLYVPHRIHRHRLSNEARGFLNHVIHWRPLHEVISNIKEIKRKTDDILTLDLVCPADTVTPEDGESSSSGVEHHSTPQILEDEIVGIQKPREDLIRQLTGGGSNHLTISVVGPGGSGKTLLVKSVYRSEEVQGHFDSHAWVRVSRSPKMRELINNILKQIGVPEEELIVREGVDIQAKLRNYLHQKRYVFVLDDIWSKGDWERIKKVLPNGSSGIRIIVTTRNTDVASFCAESQHCIHSLNCLPWQEALGLFCKKAFQTSVENCPPLLEGWSQKIVKRCEGLPEAIEEVGRWLSNKPQVPNHEWKKLHDSLGTDAEYLSIISKILLPSYEDLPSHLKCCFLYFSIFREDYSIKRGRLIRLWVAEGFVMKVKGKTPEEVAEDYLKKLIERNLVDVSKWDFDGRARCCRVRNLVLDFIVSKSEDENFVSILSELNDSLSSDKVRRLSIHNTSAILSQRSSFNSVRSTFFFSWKNFSNSDVGNVRGFKNLRVLDLQNAPVDKFPEGIDHLSLLRYLSLNHTNVKVVPKSIKKLTKLETLDLKQTFVTELPAKIVRLVNLRHLLVSRKISATSNTVQGVESSAASNTVQGVQLSAGIGALTALQKLSVVKPDKHRKIIKELGALTQLRKLGLIELETKDGKDLCACIQKMQNLLTLDLSSINIINKSLDLDHMTSPPPDLQCLYLKGRLEKLPGWISEL